MYLEELHHVQQVQLVSWRPVCHLSDVLGAPGRNHGEWVSNLNLSPFRYIHTPFQEVCDHTLWHLLSSVCQLLLTIHLSHPVIIPGLPPSLPQTVGEEREWKNLKDTRSQ